MPFLCLLLAHFPGFVLFNHCTFLCCTFSACLFELQQLLMECIRSMPRNVAVDTFSYRGIRSKVSYLECGMCQLDPPAVALSTGPSCYSRHSKYHRQSLGVRLGPWSQDHWGAHLHHPTNMPFSNCMGGELRVLMARDDWCILKMNKSTPHHM